MSRASSDRIRISGLRVVGFHGVLAAEREEGQQFLVDLDLRLPLGRAGANDDLAATVDYGTLADAVAGAVRRVNVAGVARVSGARVVGCRVVGCRVARGRVVRRRSRCRALGRVSGGVVVDRRVVLGRGRLVLRRRGGVRSVGLGGVGLGAGWVGMVG